MAVVHGESPYCFAVDTAEAMPALRRIWTTWVPGAGPSLAGPCVFTNNGKLVDDASMEIALCAWWAAAGGGDMRGLRSGDPRLKILAPVW